MRTRRYASSGSPRRATALAIAAARGAETRGINPDDLARLHRVCGAVPADAEHAPVSEDLRPLVGRLLRAEGHLDRLDDIPAPAESAPPWTGQNYQATFHATPGEFAYPASVNDQAHSQMRGATVFTRRGDHHCAGWLSIYNAIHDQPIPA